MWLQDEYEGYEGKYWSLPPRKVLPKPYGQAAPGHVVRGRQHDSSYEMAARKGLGVLGFSVAVPRRARAGPQGVQGRRSPTPSRSAPSSTTTSWSPRRPSWPRTRTPPSTRRSESRISYLHSNVFRYHDTFPHPTGSRRGRSCCPSQPRGCPRASLGTGGRSSAIPTTPWRPCRRWEAAGADQLVFALGTAPHDDALETIRLIGEHVIPKIDPDPVHRTSRFRRKAAERLAEVDVRARGAEGQA